MKKSQKLEVTHSNGFILTKESTGFTRFNCFIGLKEWAETEEHNKALTIIDNLYIRIGLSEKQISEINTILSLVPKRQFFDTMAHAARAAEHYGKEYSVRKITTHRGFVIVVCTAEQFRGGELRDEIERLMGKEVVK